MNELRTRDVVETDLPAVLSIRNRSFGPLGIGGHAWWRRVADETLGGRMLAVVDADDTILGAARIRPYEQAWGGRHLRMGGIAGVYVEPSARGRGVASLLMRAAVARMAELGDVVSCLFPTTATLYRGVGYEVGGVLSRRTYAAHALRDLRPAADGVRPRPARPADAEHVHSLLRAHHERHALSGSTLHDVEWWRRQVADEGYLYYVADDGFVAYSLVEGSLTVHDLVAGSRATAAALWSVVGSGSSAAPVVRVEVEPRDPVGLTLGALPEEAVTEQPWMLRLVDLAPAMAARGFTPHVTATARLAVTDPDSPACDGTWEIAVTGGRGTATRVQGYDAQTTDALATEGSSWSRAAEDRSTGASPAAYGRDGEPAHVGPRGLAGLWCGWTMSRLRQAGLVTGGSAEGDRALDAIFAGTPSLSEYF
ncbi:GCN5 family acetyltransferase [Intrasporangium oryzae NRRL B-24470]|uniref:GCN5 family acetyltransferase n=1 Tax=Intrasporangium oryzae NRRL B-24470 TaxID=1386089 RepID=W9G3R9_9MICO|nr:GNAT family N-acetyltransferase [Intrasporangium oryzae]EWS99951.1 GCN5 family acetyltransferase [Intrasporangium oryzae NRRL B-24470]